MNDLLMINLGSESLSLYLLNTISTLIKASFGLSYLLVSILRYEKVVRLPRVQPVVVHCKETAVRLEVHGMGGAYTGRKTLLVCGKTVP